MIENRHRQAARDSDFLKVLGGRTRILLLRELFDGEQSVRELAAAIGVLETAVSQQLTILKAAGFVSTRRQGQKIFYSLASDDARQLLEIVRKLTMKAEVEATG
ncbi:ArsR/SmtB family transcription factor [Sphingomonas trueperi]|uniref:ArsR/SmtB family transcription factor n=1 Tax=Sphingomonas trueperi TaxID=53317 RepID=UPI000EB1AD91